MIQQLIRRLEVLYVLPITYLMRVYTRAQLHEKPHTILIIQTAKLGDMVCTTPLFRAVKAHDCTKKLLVMGNATNKELLKGNPHIDEYLIAPNTLWEMVRMMRAHAIDVVCITSPSFLLLASSIIARIPCIVVPRIRNGYSPYETKSYRIVSRLVTTRDHTMGTYAPREYLRLLEPIGIYTSDTRKEIFFTKQGLEEPFKRFANAGVDPDKEVLIGILPGAGNDIKTWPPEKFTALIECIAHTFPHFVFVFLGSAHDAVRGRVIQDKLSPAVRFVDCMVMPVESLKGCVSMLSLLIGVDSGPQYIAEALGVPTIDIVGPVDEREQPPQGDRHKIVVAERKGPELHVMNARTYNREEAKRQIDAITPEMVYTVFEEMVPLIGK